VEAQRCFAAALEAQRESLEADLAMARDASAGGDARVADLERDLDAAREALGQYAADAMARLQQSERAADEAEAARERYARKYAAAARELECARGELEGARRTQATAQVAVEAMTRAVEQLAAMAATRAGRRAPELTDVEEALSLASDGLPEEFAELLWSLREPLLERCRIVAES
jgi:chromosome segregation ATPase